MTDYSTCDKCGAVLEIGELVWITADDFEPRKGEKVKLTAFKRYDALCEPCYLSELKMGKTTRKR